MHAAARLAALACFVLFLAAGSADAVTVVFSEDFDDIPLTGSPTYGLPNVWSPNPPPGWDTVDVMPGLSDPQLGVPEFEGWSFWRANAWQSEPVTGPGRFPGGNRRQRFDRGAGIVAVADPDTWDDLGRPAQIGLYNTFLITPTIDLSDLPDSTERLVLGFDTSWSGGCCDNDLDPTNNQTAVIRALFGDGDVFEVFRWESAPYFDGQGRPTLDPNDSAGNQNQPNPRFVPRAFDDRAFTLDLAPLLSGPAFAALRSSGSTQSEPTVQFEFAMEDAGDDGWWALDNVALASIPAPIPGDLYIDEVLDEKDIAEFAFGLLDEEAYKDKWWEESPGKRGSPDTEFDFDDIPYFLTVMKDAGVPAAPALLMAALQGVPEPSGLAIGAAALLAAAARRRRGGPAP